MPVTRMPREMGQSNYQNCIRFLGINQIVRKNFQRSFPHTESAERAQLRIPADKILRFSKSSLKPNAQSGFVPFIPLERFKDFKPRAGMIFDAL